MYYYIQSEKQHYWPEIIQDDGTIEPAVVTGPLWTVGCEHNGEWLPESDHDTAEKAAERVHYLNGGK